MLAPKGALELRKIFGEPGGAAASAGVALLPKPLKLGWVEKTVTSFRCHKVLESVFTRVFERIHEEGLWSALKTFDGCYNDRNIKSVAKKSSHAWGIAVDLNAETNRQGTPGDMHGGIILLFEEEGFIWGGHFTGAHRDPMHFQFIRNY